MKDQPPLRDQLPQRLFHRAEELVHRKPFQLRSQLVVAGRSQLLNPRFHSPRSELLHTPRRHRNDELVQLVLRLLLQYTSLQQPLLNVVAHVLRPLQQLNLSARLVRLMIAATLSWLPINPTAIEDLVTHGAVNKQHQHRSPLQHLSVASQDQPTRDAQQLLHQQPQPR